MSLSKPYRSPFRSPGANENTAALSALFREVLSREAPFRYCPALDPFPGDGRIRALRLRGLPCGGRESEVFAYLGVPAGASPAAPVPGMVLVHGGGGHAYAEWVRDWVERGYAAISFDGFAQTYVGTHSPYDSRNEFWAVDPASHLPPDFFAAAEQPFEAQWFTYYLADILLANTLMRADERINSDRIGLTGISWGGFAAATALGYDRRFAFAAPVYGCGFQDISGTEWGRVFRGPGISDVWDAKLLLPTVETPVHWFNGDSDPFFDAASSTASAAATKHGTLTLLPEYPHAQTEGAAIRELFRFADEQTGRGPGNIRIEGIEMRNGCVAAEFSLPEDVDEVSAFLYYKTEGLRYRGKHLHEAWSRRTGKVKNGVALIPLPDDAALFYVALRGETRREELLHASGGLFAPPTGDGGTCAVLPDPAGG